MVCPSIFSQILFGPLSRPCNQPSGIPCLRSCARPECFQTIFCRTGRPNAKCAAQSSCEEDCHEFTLDDGTQCWGNRENKQCAIKSPAHHVACPQKIKEAYTGKPGDPNYDHLSSVQHVRVFYSPNKDDCQHVIAQGYDQDYLYQFLFHCDTLEMTHAQYWKHTNEYAWRTFNHESCIPEGETQACGGDPCLICKEEALGHLGEVTHKCHLDFSKPECGRSSPPAEVAYSPALLDACFPAATVEIEDDSAPSSTGCCYEFKKFKDGRQESYCFESSKTIGSQAECPEGSQ